MKERGSFMLENEVYRAVAQVANAIKEDDVLMLDVSNFHVSVVA